MNWMWRALVAGLLLGGTVIWVPAMANAASTPSVTGVRTPAGDNHDNENKDDNGNTDDNENVNDNVDDNGNVNDNWDDNENSNDNDSDASGLPSDPNNPNIPTDPSHSGAQVQNADLTVDLWRSTDYPVVNTPFQLAVTGSGAPIERIWIWADGPGGAGPAGDDFAHRTDMTMECSGLQPCYQNWHVVARNAGYYSIHARVRDTSGREAQTDWYILISENPRSG